jgi:DedD protein
MPLPSFFKRKPAAVPEKGRRKAAAAPAGDDGALVEAARTRARRRLIGAVVLLAVGIIVFPLVFETQPRPVALDTPIEVPARAREAALPAAKPAAPAAPVASAPVVAEAPRQPIETEIEPAPKPAPAEPPKTEVPPPKPVAEAPPPKPAASTPPAIVAATPKAEESARARALLEGRPAASQPAAANGRFVVQVGAYTDTQALREARQKVEKLGLKTYTQVVETDAGKRTRVRVGPFASREEADSAGAKLKSAGLPANVLAL